VERKGGFRLSANKIVYITLGLLLVIVAILAYLNRGDAELRDALKENREFQIRVDGVPKANVDLKKLIELTPQEFKTTFSTSLSGPRETTLKGVELRILLGDLEIDFSNAGRILVSGLDSYYSPLSREEVEKEETVYICFSMDGEILKSQSEGGYGPYLLVIRGAQFAQRWCKYVEAVDIVGN